MRYLFCLLLVSISFLTACGEVKEESSHLKAKMDQFGPGPNVEDELNPLF